MPGVAHLLETTPLVQDLGESIQIGDEDRRRRAGLGMRGSSAPLAAGRRSPPRSSGCAWAPGHTTAPECGSLREVRGLLGRCGHRGAPGSQSSKHLVKATLNIVQHSQAHAHALGVPLEGRADIVHHIQHASEHGLDLECTVLQLRFPGH